MCCCYLHSGQPQCNLMTELLKKQSKVRLFVTVKTTAYLLSFIWHFQLLNCIKLATTVFWRRKVLQGSALSQIFISIIMAKILLFPKNEKNMFFIHFYKRFPKIVFNAITEAAIFVVFWCNFPSHKQKYAYFYKQQSFSHQHW